MSEPIRGIHVSVLGPVQMWNDGRSVDLGTPRQRSILAALALSLGRTVSLETLVTRVWGASAPATAISTLQRYVASLRRAIEPDRAAHETPKIIVTDGDGYALRIPSGDRDVFHLEHAVSEARALLASVSDPLRPWVAPEHASDAARAAELLHEALELWRGHPYADLGDDPEATAERARLEDVRTTARELRLIAQLALGRHAEVAGELEALTALHPLHERWWALYAVALVRSGRQGEALEALNELRSILVGELGVDPSPPLRDLHTAILRQDATLTWTAGAPEAPSAGSKRPSGQTSRKAQFVPRWPLAGRAAEIGSLSELLRRVRENSAASALIAGAAGVGKTRLAQELALRAEKDGFTVVVSSCSQQSPPALWPLRVAMISLARQLESFEVSTTRLDTQPEEFSTRQHVIDTFTRASAVRPLLVVIEDVQWADVLTLEVLADMVSRRDGSPIMLVLTRRTDAGDDAQIAKLAATVARTEGLRIDLEGLSLSESTELVVSAGGSVDAVRALWQRSGGNPFFLTELALADGTLSGSLADVVHSRVMSLAPATVTALQAASTIDVSFDTRLLARMLGRDEAETVELLQPAVQAGLTMELNDRTSAHAFTHGVVREVVQAQQTHVARSTWHACAGLALADHGDLRRVGQRSAMVHHWEQAGRSWAAEAWRAILKAARHAQADAAYAEEARYLRLAGPLLEMDLDAGDRERFELLMLSADASRWSGDWDSVRAAVGEAIALAERLDDGALAARAAIAASEGALWHGRSYGAVHAPIVDALERMLFRLGDQDDPLRCRAQLALAMELYYDAGQTDRVGALVDEAVKFAEENGDPRLQFTAYLGAFVSTWRLDTLERRASLAERALDVARRLDDPRVLVMAETLTLVAASELGDAARVRSGLDRVIELARLRGLTTPEGVLRVLALGWASLDGDTDQVETQTESLGSLMRDARLPNFNAAAGGTMLTAAWLSGNPEALHSTAAEFTPDQGVPTALFGASVLVRVGKLEAARALLAAESPSLDTHTYLGALNAAMACQVAAALGPTGLTAEAYAFLNEHAGRMCSAGSAAVIGPVDLYLALGAKALGDQEAAVRHLAAAQQLIEEWATAGLVHELNHVRDVVQRVELAG